MTEPRETDPRVQKHIEMLLARESDRQLYLGALVLMQDKIRPVRKELNQLEKRRRELIIAAFNCEASIAAIADNAGISRTRVKQILDQNESKTMLALEDYKKQYQRESEQASPDSWKPTDDLPDQPHRF